MKAGPGTITLVVALLVVFGIELATHSVGNEAFLLKLGALPDNGALHGQYWRVATYSFLHFNDAHLFVNVLLLFWVGRIVESWVGIAYAAAIYVSSVFSSAAVILLFHNLHPKAGATVGASGGIFGLLAAALIISHRHGAGSLDRENRLRTWLWIAFLAGLGISFLPGISMAGHVGGLIGGTLLACIAKFRKTV
ncbi:MAG TPA: rhomboid family intramembrane serine protease [Candidatus Udaeobacter sp.]|nr:rhomboid family intramembrane serine protease [Candidatus Udaeobacter sp.]